MAGPNSYLEKIRVHIEHKLLTRADVSLSIEGLKTRKTRAAWAI
jgi:hypothetical protein